ncbi:hypothetical protein IJG20_00900 [Candidatus Saccharibacteria bacterium]|nr:hypothetical protein [Candidatus Saccharibacteria bacterium]
MTKQRKNFVGILCLVVVVLMTVFAFFLPGEAHADDGSTDTYNQIIRVTVYDQYPAVKITNPENDSTTVAPTVEVKFDYENTEYIDFELSYVDEDGNTQVVSLPRFNPSDLDPSFHYASGSDSVTIDLTGYTLGYEDYILTAKASSAVGYAEDSVEFSYLPAKLTQIGNNLTNNDPDTVVEYGEGVAKLEIEILDENGNPVFDEPIIIEVDEPYEAGEVELELPFGSYGLESGKYYARITSYAYVDDGEGGLVLEKIAAPDRLFPISYTKPASPAVPDTGRFLSNLNIAKSDYIITGVIVFASVVLVAFTLLSRKKKDYRKNYRKRH